MPNDVVDFLRQIKREELLADFADFCRDTRILADFRDRPHREMCYEVATMRPNRKSRKQKRKVYLAPRYSYKTSIIRAFIVFCILHDIDIRIVVICDGKDAASSNLDVVKDILTKNPVILELWGDLSIGAHEWTKYAITVKGAEVRKDPTVYAVGAGQDLTGRHPDLVLMDDPVGDKNCDSIVEMNTARKSLVSTYALLSPYGCILVTGTRWSAIDLYGWILNQNAEQRAAGEDPSYEEYVRTVYVKNDAGDEEQLFFPDVLNEEFLAKQKRDLPSRFYDSFYFQRIYGGLKTFPDLQYFEGTYEPGPFPNVTVTKLIGDQELFVGRSSRHIPLWVVVLMDPTLTAETSSDFVGLVVVGFDGYGDWWVFEAHEIKKVPSAVSSDVLRLVAIYEPNELYIESGAVDAGMVARLQDGIRELRVSCVIKAYSSLQDERQGKRSKTARIEAMEPIARNRKLHIQVAKCVPLVQQLDMYPGLENDDVLDALSTGRTAQERMPKEFPKSFEEALADPPGEDRDYDSWRSWAKGMVETQGGRDPSSWPGYEEPVKKGLHGTWTGRR